jgi:hypothetical protein
MTQGIVDIVHRAGEVMKFCSRLATLLPVAPQPTLDMVKCRLPALLRGADIPTFHPAHQFTCAEIEKLLAPFD